MPNLQLKADGKIYSGWTAMRRHSGIEQAAGAFALELTERWPGQPQRWPLEPGTACQLLLDDTPVITGHVDRTERSFDADSHRVRVTGRDAAGDLVDCAALQQGDRTDSIAKQSLPQVLEMFAKPYGVAVINRMGDTSRFEQVNYEAGDTIWDVVAPMARQLAVLLISDGLGNLVITRAGSETHPARLVQGENILAARFDRDDSRRFHRYIARNQSPTDGSTDRVPSQVSEQEATAVDEAVRAPRTTVFIPETLADGVTMQQRVDWERAHRRAMSRRLVLTVQGWSANGRVWQPNELVHVEIPVWGLKGPLLIVAVDQSLDRRGTLSELTLAPREAYDLLPEGAADAGGGDLGVSADMLELLS